MCLPTSGRGGAPDDFMSVGQDPVPSPSDLPMRAHCPFIHNPYCSDSCRQGSQVPESLTRRKIWILAFSKALARIVWSIFAVLGWPGKGLSGLRRVK